MSINPLLEAYRSMKREIALIASAELKSQDIGLKQMTILFYLEETSQATASDLSLHTQSDPASVTRALQSMESVGWVKRKTDPLDNRRTHIELTAKGKGKLESMEPVRKNISDRISKTLSGKDIKELERLMRTVADGLIQQRQSR